jgi:hypothetical protein
MENKPEIIGNWFKADFGQMAFQLHFESATQMTFAQILPNQLGVPETVQTNMVEVRPNVYMVYWKEKSGITVTHVEDFQNEVVYTNITSPDNNFINLKGTLTPIK